MSLTSDIFKRSEVIYETLIPYGFIKTKDGYLYNKDILENTFNVEIFIKDEIDMDIKVVELATNEEYSLYKVKDVKGEFVNLIKEELTKILLDIKKKCFKEVYFLSNQANRISELIFNKYGETPSFPWPRFPSYGVFKHHVNKKWYGLIMSVDLTKLGASTYKEVEIINVKLDEDEIKELLTKEGFYEAYHMNKKMWVSIILDETLSDEEILTYLSKSYELTK